MSPTTCPSSLSLEERFWRGVTRREHGACWQWGNRTTLLDYATIKMHGKQVGAHRVSYELHFGPIPDGMFVCHRCDNRHCVNPEHLFLGTQLDNMRDCSAKGRIRTGERRGSSNPHAALNDDAVREIRRRVGEGERRDVVAAAFGITVSALQAVVVRKRWAHVL